MTIKPKWKEWNLISSWSCKAHSQNIFGPTNFGTQKYTSTEIFPEPKLFSDQRNLILSTYFGDKQNSGLTFFAAQIFQVPKVLISHKVFQPKSYQWPTNYLDQKIFWRAKKFYDQMFFIEKLFWIKIFLDPKFTWTFILFCIQNFLLD